MYNIPCNNKLLSQDRSIFFGIIICLSIVMNFQKANVFNQYLPYSSAIYRQSLASFDEICENLSRLIQAQELQPGFPLWSSKLQQFLSLYGFSFTKANHLKLIHFYLSILSIQDLNYIHAKISFDLIVQLTRFVLLINFQTVHVFFLSCIL